MTSPLDHRSRAARRRQAEEAGVRGEAPHRAGRARELAEQAQARLRQVVEARAGLDALLDAKDGGDRAPTRFWLRLHAPEPERSLSMTIDPIAGTLTWAYHYAGALVRGQTVPLRDVDRDYIESIVRPFEDDSSWRKGRFAVRADRVSGARD
jgi:hypothetical protein